MQFARPQAQTTALRGVTSTGEQLGRPDSSVPPSCGAALKHSSRRPADDRAGKKSAESVRDRPTRRDPADCVCVNEFAHVVAFRFHSAPESIMHEFTLRASAAMLLRVHQCVRSGAVM